MNFFDKLFISFYNYFRNRGDQDAKFAAICMLICVQLLMIFLPLLLIKTLYQSTAFSFAHPYSRIIGAVIGSLWILIVSFRYTKEKVAILSEIYNIQSESFKRVWKWMPLILIVLLLLAFYLIIELNQHLQNV
jgi:hypothetical protein